MALGQPQGVQPTGLVWQLWGSHPALGTDSKQVPTPPATHTPGAAELLPQPLVGLSFVQQLPRGCFGVTHGCAGPRNCCLTPAATPAPSAPQRGTNTYREQATRPAGSTATTSSSPKQQTHPKLATANQNKRLPGVHLTHLLCSCRAVTY